MGKFDLNYVLNVETFAGPVVIAPPFTVEFDVTRAHTLESAHAAIRVYNLSRVNQELLRKDRNVTNDNLFRVMSLNAGYGPNMPMIFQGRLHQGSSQLLPQGRGVVTNLENFGSAFGLVNSDSSQAAFAGQPLKQVLTNLLADFQGAVPGGVGNYADSAGKPILFPRGTALSGNTGNLLDELSGGGFFVDLGRSYCLADNECIEGDIQVIDSSFGLLTTPVLELNRLRLDIMFEPRLLVGQLVTLESFTAPSYNGDYKVFSIQHRAKISDAECGSAVTSVVLYKPDGVIAVVA